ncbi:MAG: nitronate monooxygenase [Deltaproteobacteria bacterium]|nr:nitronate monooxygenase [Deltaproteobacteria bacterium]MBW1920105.1 nitronate monooxygenase [Deltaproteobacteria bacterium]MBW1936185.1 nitronate monooxygenase [Deltaproteobacteria bacterium]MBW2043617.1 nitronate monooxygenase [Deltaproteobacteria bacterium]RLB32874.1 MAG: nitronate monooxygenase [Deltaproteobacteria bacterium]
MFKTELTQMLGIKYPIVGGTMMWITTPEFVAAISNAGGLGILASAIYQSREDFARALDRTRELTDRPFAVNLNLFPAMRPIDNNEYLDVLIDKDVKIVETSGHSAPEDLCARFKKAGMIWIHKCVGVRYALKVQDMGADIVTVVGYENGGATGKLDIGTIVLVPRVVDSVDIPVIGGGGVADGRGFLAVLSLGAQGVIIGTRLLATQEAPIHEKLKQALVRASELDTMLVMRSIGATHRVWVNAAAKKCVELENARADFSEILKVVGGENAKKMYESGDLDAGIISCGEGIGLAHDIPTVEELFERIIREAAHIVNGFAKS